MGLTIQIGFLLLLFLILATLVMQERRLGVAKTSSGKMRGYWDGQERRKDVRINTALAAKYSVEPITQSKTKTVSKNISMGGILLELSEKLFPPTQVLLDIFLPNENSPIAAKGEV